MESMLFYNNKPKENKGMSKIQQLINQIDTDPDCHLSFRAAEEADKELLLKEKLIEQIRFRDSETGGIKNLMGTVEEIVDRIWPSIVKVINH